MPPRTKQHHAKFQRSWSNSFGIQTVYSNKQNGGSEDSGKDFGLILTIF